MASLTPFESNVQYQIPNEVWDNISDAHPTLDALLKNSPVMWSGRKFVPNMISALTTTSTYSPTAVTAIATDQATTLKGAQYDLDGHYITPYSLTQQEIENGESELAIVKSGEEKYMTAIKSHVSLLSDDLFNGTGAGNTVIGLDSMKSTTATFGAMDPAVETWWVSQTNTAATIFNQLSDLNLQIEQCTDGSDRPDMGIVGQTLHARLLDLAAMGGYYPNLAGEAKLGVDSVIYRGVKFHKDKDATANHLYLLPTKYVKLVLHPKFKFYDTGLNEPTTYTYRHGNVRTSIGLACFNRRRVGGFTNLTVS
jgi:hypothetical protein